MPSFEGIEVSIVTQPELTKLPEFPLSDTSYRRVLLSDNQLSRPSLAGPSRVRSRSQQLQKNSPRISVYIPSDPGSRFAIHYELHETSQLPRYLYFKVFMNGRNVVNCGVKTLKNTSGSITRSLCEPSERWKYKEGGMLLIRDGIEARCFSFLPHAFQSVAEDGGLIEVRIFRAKGRHRKLPALEGHRGQESYGIGSPSGGLIDSSEEAYYYDWILIDSKESPYISFHFHYRSLLNLRRLSLAPGPSELAGILIDMEHDIVENKSEEICSTIPTHVRDATKASSARKHRAASPSNSESDDASSVEEELYLPARTRRLTEIAPLKLRPKASARPLPEIPAKKPVDQGDVEKQVMDHEYTALSDIQEETEHTDLSITTSLPSLPDRCLSPCTIKARVLELNDCGIIPPQSALKRDTSSTILESLVNYSELPEQLQNRVLSASVGKMVCLETKQPEHSSEMRSIAAEAEHSFRTGWELNESDWMKGGV
ncbi:hypothetical protein FBEOM_3776 [Fusarium beomiforme]|uniref:Uncharacterized protein n=1 Tax=Fusarium beomiforme TaxID=44412 RepID=A0A9P5AP39_9HYPO|nr:hypothetical protein FBEOM_3776 [Fusarium beomiforme]